LRAFEGIQPVRTGRLPHAIRVLQNVLMREPHDRDTLWLLDMGVPGESQ
jgi:hypothetical protein